MRVTVAPLALKQIFSETSQSPAVKLKLTKSPNCPVVGAFIKAAVVEEMYSP
jgi:hypothetical protein